MKPLYYKKEDYKNIPQCPGVYLFKDDRGQTLYIGKSVNLKNRVGSYFTGKKEDRVSDKILRMVKFIDRIVIKVTPTELEAELLEQEMIEKERPQYNQQMKNRKRHGFLLMKEDGNVWKWETVNLNSEKTGFCIGPFRNPGSIARKLDILSRFNWLKDWSYQPLTIHYEQGKLSEVMQWIQARMDRPESCQGWLNKLIIKRDLASGGLEFESAGRYQEVIEGVQLICSALSRKQFFSGEVGLFFVKKDRFIRYGYYYQDSRLIRVRWTVQDQSEEAGMSGFINFMTGRGSFSEKDWDRKEWGISNLDQEMILYRGLRKEDDSIMGCIMKV